MEKDGLQFLLTHILKEALALPIWAQFRASCVYPAGIGWPHVRKGPSLCLFSAPQLVSCLSLQLCYILEVYPTFPRLPLTHRQIVILMSEAFQAITWKYP